MNRYFIRILGVLSLGIILSVALGQQSAIEVSGYDCGDCHGATGWDILEFSGFSHQSTGFLLEGAHAAQPCYACHTGNTLSEKHQFQDVNTVCSSCHLDIHQSTLGEDCTFCHEFTSWQVTQKTFNHETTRFPLQGAHRGIACDQCHTEHPMTRFDFVDTDCFACHQTDYNRALNPSHVLARFNRDCRICHTDHRAGWRPSLFDHADTDFLLTGVHIVTECAECHINGQFEDTPESCQAANCHFNDFQTTDSPNHMIYGYPEQYCEECHVTLGWTPSIYTHTIDYACSSCHIPDFQNALNPIHNVENGFSTNCEGCHVDVESWAGATFDHSNVEIGSCASCHLSNYNATTSPNHSAAGFSTNCTLCHQSTSDWQQVLFDHDPAITIPCSDCHMSDYNETASNPSIPNHVDSGFSTDCTQCHTSTSDWAQINFDHTSVSIPCADCHMPDYNNLPNATYPNAPNHAELGLTTDCTICHNSTSDWTDVTFSHTSVDNLPCADCHLNQYNNTTDPDHGASGFTTDCTQCHTSTSDWTQVNFDHNLVTVPCADCHMPDYNNTANSSNPDVPNHVDSGFTTDCTQCHVSTSDWSQVDFNHATVTAPCADCHMPDYNNLPNATYPDAPNHADLGLSTDCTICHNSTTDWTDVTFTHTSVSDIPCADCHLNQYNNTTDPNHSASGFSTDCTLCHNSTSDWLDVTFDHSNISQPCADCHLEDYNSAINPNHISQQYPTTCEDCHTTTSWTPADFDHDTQYFPIYSGKHDNEWSTCTAECHINPSEYSVFSCGLNGVCHEHDRASMDDKHQGEVSGYVYESNACYNCHPDGTEEGGDGDEGGDIIRDWRDHIKRIRK